MLTLYYALMYKRTALMLCTIFISSTSVSSAWTGPSTSAPNGNVSAPVNVGSTDQVKSATLGMNGLAVFGNSLLQASSYLNWGATSGSTGYGIRDNAGTLEFKNSGGSWASLQSLVYSLTGGTSVWSTSGTTIYNNNTGRVGIGTAGPSSKLQVIAASGESAIFANTSGSAYGVYGSSPGYIGVRGDGASTNWGGYFTGGYGTYGQASNSGYYAGYFYNAGSGYYGILGYSSYSLYGNGHSYLSGYSYASAFYHISDERMKENVTTSKGLDVITRLRGVLFKWKDTDTESHGVIAQEVEEVFPSAVSVDPNGMKTVDYDQLIAPLIESVKELKEENDAQNAEIKKLKDELANYQASTNTQ